jgi:predicted RNA-binding Zn ribbon-like protein
MSTREPGSAAGTMKLVGGDPCLDFVNTVGGRVDGGRRARSSVRNDKLRAYSDLVAWSRHTGLTGDAEARALLRLAHRRPREAARVLARAERLRESLYRVLRALMAGERPPAADLDAVTVELSAARGEDRLALGPHGLRWTSPAAGERLDSVLWPVGRAAAALLTADLSRLRQCGGEDCGWLFLDRSRNRSRQWCTMEDCGNVSKVRRFRQRRRRRTRRDKEDVT